MAWSSAAEQTSLFQIAELIISTQRVLLSIFPLIIEQATQQQEARYGKMAFKGPNTIHTFVVCKKFAFLNCK